MVSDVFISGTMTTSTPGGVAWTKMGEIKHEYLPRVVMADDLRVNGIHI